MPGSTHPHDIRFGNPLLAEGVCVSGGVDEITEQHCSRAFPVRMVVCDIDDTPLEFEAWWTVHPSATRHDIDSPHNSREGREHFGAFISGEPVGLSGTAYGFPAYAVSRGPA